MSGAEAGDTNLRVEDTQTDVDARRSDRWAAEPDARRNGWSIVAAVLVLAAYVAAGLGAASVGGSVALSDDAQLGLVGAAPGLAVVGAILSWVGSRRPTLRVVSWLVFALAILLLAVAAGLLALLLLALGDV